LWAPILEAEEANDDVERFDDADDAKAGPASLALREEAPQDLDRFDDGSDDEQAATGDVAKEAPTRKAKEPSHQEDDEQGYDMRKRYTLPAKLQEIDTV